MSGPSQLNQSTESAVNVDAFGIISLRHKAEVPPVFITYKWVSSEGNHISLMQIATTVLKAVANSTALDTIQPMKQGWYMYIKTNADHECLVQKGVTIAGRFITL